MARPTRKIKCKTCEKKIDAIILKEYVIESKNHNVDQFPIFQKLLIKYHKRGFIHRHKCNGSNYKFTLYIDHTVSPQAKSFM